LQRYHRDAAFLAAGRGKAMIRRCLRALLLPALLVHGAAFAANNMSPADDPAASAVWKKVRASLFDNRPIEAARDDLLTLEVPARAVDAAVVPVAIRSKLAAGGATQISKVWLVIDANPSPVGAIFSFTPETGRADIETRVRVDAYSVVRAIAETSDGRLHMATRFVKASGGCSAPAGADAAAAAASMGQMRFRVDGDIKANAPVLAQLAISHPNHSGLAMDQTSRLFTPAHFVRKVDVSYGGKPVMSADVDFSISENPNFRFYFLPHGGTGELRATVVDTQDKRFSAALALGDAR
jgi:sulfur-oxidizing protein SoxY